MFLYVIEVDAGKREELADSEHVTGFVQNEVTFDVRRGGCYAYFLGVDQVAAKAAFECVESVEGVIVGV